MKLLERDLQRVLAKAGFYNGDIDGDVGSKTKKAIGDVLAKYIDELPNKWTTWDMERKGVAATQLILDHSLEAIRPGAIDGLWGMLSDYALQQWDYLQLNGSLPIAWRPDDKPEPADDTLDTTWPRQGDVEKFFGKAGGEQCTAGEVILPFDMRIAWDKKTIIKSFRCHERVADSAQRAYNRIHSAYSGNEISLFGFNLFGGCYNFRNKRGGSTLSMHAYGIAIDTDPERNQLKWGRDRAYLALPKCEEFLKCWEAEGWLSLGRARNYDWMHVQAARL